MPHTCQAPWPKGFNAKWWYVFKVRTFTNTSAYNDLIDVRRFFWSSHLCFVCNVVRSDVFARVGRGLG